METIKSCEFLSLFIINNMQGPFCCIMEWEGHKDKFYINERQNMYKIT